MKGFFSNIFLFIVLVCICGGAYFAYEANLFLSTPGSPENKEIIITIEPGATFDRVAWDLRKAGVITDVDRFRLLAHFEGSIGKIKAGEFQVNTNWKPQQVLKQITEGKAVLYRLAIREGLTWWETARAVEEQGFAGYDDFKAVIHDPVFLKEHSIPFANAEGFLFPETYLLKKPRSPLDKEQAKIVASAMVKMFWKKTEPIWTGFPLSASAIAARQANATAVTGNATLQQAEALPRINAEPIGNATVPVALKPKTPAEVDPSALKHLIIMASLVEKETGVPAERGLVAGVYANRLSKKMLLQCDPTIIYGVGESFSGSIRRSQLDDAGNLYNTYKHAGLPPGPICSSGFDALSAADKPTAHDFYYFVATGIDAGHTFSRSLDEHNKAVQIYRARMKAN